MSNQKLIKLTTEGDEEGRTTSTVGLFLGTLDQVITYCIENNIKPYYNFKASDVTVVDVSNIEPKVVTSIGSYGRIEYKTPEDLKVIAARNAALSKLSEEERKLLGL